MHWLPGKPLLVHLRVTFAVAKILEGHADGAISDPQRSEMLHALFLLVALGGKDFEASGQRTRIANGLAKALADPAPPATGKDGTKYWAAECLSQFALLKPELALEAVQLPHVLDSVRGASARARARALPPFLADRSTAYPLAPRRRFELRR
jgi:hypothetical protein